MEEGIVQEKQKAVWYSRKVDVGVFSSPEVASSFLAQRVKKEYLSCWEVDLIFKSADRNITHVLSKGYSPVEYLVEFVAMGEFPETSSIDRVSSLQSEQESSTGWYGRLNGLPTLHDLCVFDCRVSQWETPPFSSTVRLHD